MIEWDCGYEDCHHEFPDDWWFGGADGNDPRMDFRWQPISYIYLDADMEGVWQTTAPICDGQALDEFTKIQQSAGYDPPLKYIMARRPDEGKPHILPFQYNVSDDTVYPLK